MHHVLPEHKTRRKRVLMIARNFPPVTGGMERMLFNVHAQLCRSFDVILLGPQGCETYVPPSTTVVTVPRTPLWKFLTIVTFRAWQLATRYKPDFVLSGGGLTAPASLIAGNVARAKTACFVYGLDLVVDSQLYQKCFVPALRRHDLIFSISHNTTALARSKGMAEQSIKLLMPGVALPTHAADTDKAAFLKRIGARPTDIILLSVGRLSPRKGLVEFITQTMPRLVAAVPDVRLVVIGNEPAHALKHAPGQSERLRLAVKKMALETRVNILGEVDDTTLRHAYYVARLLVFPVLNLPGDVEGFGMVAIEAAAHGVPTVAFAVGGVPDAVAHGQSGYLVASGDYEQFAETVVRHIRSENPETWHSRCVAHARRFSWESYGDRLCQLIDDATPLVNNTRTPTN